MLVLHKGGQELFSIPQVYEMVIHIAMAGFYSLLEQDVNSFDQAVYSEFVILQAMSEPVLKVC